MLLDNGDKSDENFSCAKCFTAISFGPQSKNKQLRELFPETKHVVEQIATQNVTIDESKVIEHKKE